MTKPDQQFMSDKKESIALVIYQIAQMDKSIVQMAERLDVVTNRMETRLNALELWKASFNQKIAYQEQVDVVRSEIATVKKIIGWVSGFIIAAFLTAVAKLVFIK